MNAHAYSHGILRESDPRFATSHFCHFCWPALIPATHWDAGYMPEVPCCASCGGKAGRVCSVPSRAMERVS